MHVCMYAINQIAIQVKGHEKAGLGLPIKRPGFPPPPPQDSNAIPGSVWLCTIIQQSSLSPTVNFLVEADYEFSPES